MEGLYDIFACCDPPILLRLRELSRDFYDALRPRSFCMVYISLYPCPASSFLGYEDAINLMLQRDMYDAELVKHYTLEHILRGCSVPNLHNTLLLFIRNNDAAGVRDIKEWFYCDTKTRRNTPDKRLYHKEGIYNLLDDADVMEEVMRYNNQRIIQIIIDLFTFIDVLSPLTIKLLRAAVKYDRSRVIEPINTKYPILSISSMALGGLMILARRYNSIEFICRLSIVTGMDFCGIIESDKSDMEMYEVAKGLVKKN